MEEKPKLPFVMQDGKIKVSVDFLKEHKEHIEELASKKGMKPMEYLSSVAEKKYGKTSFAGEVKPKKVEFTDEQKEKIANIAAKNGLSTAELLAIFHQETGGTFAPSTLNPAGGAVGIIQFVPSTAADMLLREQRAFALSKAKTPEEEKQAKKQNKLYGELTPEERKRADEWGNKNMANLSLDRQLDIADLYLTTNAKGEKGFEKIYSAIFSGSPQAIKEIKKGEKGYANNAGLDENKDGTITREEWLKKARRFVGMYEGVIPNTGDVSAETRADRVHKLLASDPEYATTKQSIAPSKPQPKLIDRSTAQSMAIPEGVDFPKAPQMPDITPSPMQAEEPKPIAPINFVSEQIAPELKLTTSEEEEDLPDWLVSAFG